MRKKGMRAISLMLSAVLVLSAVIPVNASPGPSKMDLNPLVAVIEKVEPVTVMNLTEEGSVDWVHISGEQVNRKKNSGEIIQWENLDKDRELSNASDTPMSYHWTDGDKTPQKDGEFRYAGVFIPSKEEAGPVETDAGYRITIPAAEETRTLTFVSGIWQAAANIEISVNGQNTPVHTMELKAGEAAVVNKYTVTVRTGNLVTVTARIKETYHKHGNLSLGGIALKTSEPSQIKVKVQDVSEVPALNLTERGDVDWVHFEGDVNNNQPGVTARKAGVVSQITYRNLSSDQSTTMTDARVKYTWTDGTPVSSAENNTTGAVYNYRNGIPGSENVLITEPAGYELKIAASDYDRELVLVSGVWSADAALSIVMDGSDIPVYENNELTAGGDVVNKVYTIAIGAGKGLTVTGQIKKKSNIWGNLNLQAAALSSKMTLRDYRAALRDQLKKAKEIDLSEYEEFYANQLESEIHYSEMLLEKGGTDAEYYSALIFLTQAYESCLNIGTSGSYKYESNPGLTSSFGWEGDVHAPISFIDGSYRLRDNGNKMVTFGVKDIPGKIKWYNAEGYLPCFVSEYSKNGMNYKVENFANKHIIDGKDFEIAYSRMTVTNSSDTEQKLPKVSASLIPLNEETENAVIIDIGETIVRDYAIGADRFGGKYDYPENDAIVDMGGFDENYTAMKEYWNNRLEPLTRLNLPDEKLVNAYKAGFIYTLIIRDDIDGVKELHVGENGYDELFDHDTIGIVASLLLEGDFTYAKEYLAALPAQLQYDDAKWKYSWPYALYLSKTGDYDYIQSKFEMIKMNTHKVETDRIDEGEGIIKQTFAIDSPGYWLIDNWSALAGLTTYHYLCEEMYAKTGDKVYQREKSWAKAEYDSLLAAVEAAQHKMREDNNYLYLSIDMNVPTENSQRSDARDANWASMFLFGRWGWDGYLFGADQEGSEMINLIDDTYTHGFERRADISDTIYNFGGYPHGYYSSAYNAGYGSTALRGERYRDLGIKAYQFMIENAMSGPFGWWEGVNYPNNDSPWESNHAQGGGGSCQHMWGQSTASKVLIDSLIAEKVNDKIIIGRGVPAEWIEPGQSFSVSNHVVEKGKKIGYSVKASEDGSKVTVIFEGDTTELPFSIELLGLKNKIVSVKGNFVFDNEAGVVTVPAGTKEVVINLTEKPEESGKDPEDTKDPEDVKNPANEKDEKPETGTESVKTGDMASPLIMYSLVGIMVSLGVLYALRKKHNTK